MMFNADALSGRCKEGRVTHAACAPFGRTPGIHMPIVSSGNNILITGSKKVCICGFSAENHRAARMIFLGFFLCIQQNKEHLTT